MGKRIIITESEKNNIRRMYGLITEQAETPVCGVGGCSGKYIGPEFDNNGDVAHKYSNTMTQYVAAKLKELYKSGTYVKVDFSKIKMTTKGMGTGNVVYTVTIPFVVVSDKCDARTGFAHVGGWGHTPELATRKNEILSYIPSGKSQNTVLDKELDVSQLTRTPEGLEEYWIQWRHRDYQSDCVSGQQNTNQPVTIQGNGFNELRTNLKDKTVGVSIDENSVKIDINTFTVTYNPGQTKIQNMSLIFDDSGQLNNRIPNIKKQNPTLVEKDKGKVGNIEWLLVIIK